MKKGFPVYSILIAMVAAAVVFAASCKKSKDAASPSAAPSTQPAARTAAPPVKVTSPVMTNAPKALVAALPKPSPIPGVKPQAADPLEVNARRRLDDNRFLQWVVIQWLVAHLSIGARTVLPHSVQLPS